MALLVSNNSLLRVLLMKNTIKFQNASFLIRDKNCYLTFGLRLMEPYWRVYVQVSKRFWPRIWEYILVGKT